MKQAGKLRKYLTFEKFITRYLDCRSVLVEVSDLRQSIRKKGKEGWKRNLKKRCGDWERYKHSQ